MYTINIWIVVICNIYSSVPLVLTQKFMLSGAMVVAILFISSAIYRCGAGCAVCWCACCCCISTLAPLELGEELVADPADIREKAIKVSGKFGGVAGVLHGVITCNTTTCVSLYVINNLHIKTKQNPRIRKTYKSNNHNKIEQSIENILAVFNFKNIFHVYLIYF